MARRPRKLSDSNIYHVVFRGINKQKIFVDDEDCLKLLQKLKKLKEEMKFEVYAYCLMSNHVHLLIKEKNFGDISMIMKRLLITYASYFNRKYKRIGKVINDRYLSIPVKNDAYILNLVRYIHQNPVKIGMSIDYKWSSYRDYFDIKNDLLDGKFIISMIGKENFIMFNNAIETGAFEPNDRIMLSDNEIKQEILEIYGINPNIIRTFEKNKRNLILSILRKRYSIRQISRVTGIDKNTISNNTTIENENRTKKKRPLV